MIELHNATIHKVKTMVDRTLRVELNLRELPPNEMAILMSAYMNGEEGLKFDNKSDSKSPSQRLRAVIFKYYEQSGAAVSFEDFYSDQMEKIINKYKSIINTL